jgi:hypothetical protein
MFQWLSSDPQNYTLQQRKAFINDIFIAVAELFLLHKLIWTYQNTNQDVIIQVNLINSP